MLRANPLVSIETGEKEFVLLRRLATHHGRPSNKKLDDMILIMGASNYNHYLGNSP
jgi:hypothetical protein